MNNCRICKIEIEAIKLASHEYYCEKNAVKCELCEKFYDKNVIT